MVRRLVWLDLHGWVLSLLLWLLPLLSWLLSLLGRVRAVLHGILRQQLLPVAIVLRGALVLHIGMWFVWGLPSLRNSLSMRLCCWLRHGRPATGFENQSAGRPKNVRDESSPEQKTSQRSGSGGEPPRAIAGNPD